MNQPKQRETITIVKKNFIDFIQKPRESFKEIFKNSVGRVNIIIGKRTVFLMTQEKFEFFVKYRENKKIQALEDELKKCKDSKLNSKKTDSLLEPIKQIEKVASIENTLDATSDERLTPSQKTLLQIKSRFQLFKNLRDSEVLKIVDDITISQYEKGKKVFTVGTTGKDMYFIVRGDVSVHIGPGGDIKVATLGKTQFFGEMAYIMEEPRTATIKIESEVALLLSFTIKTKVVEGAESAFMKFFSNINHILSHKLIAENRKKG